MQQICRPFNKAIVSHIYTKMYENIHVVYKIASREVLFSGIMRGPCLLCFWDGWQFVIVIFHLTEWWVENVSESSLLSLESDLVLFDKSSYQTSKTKKKTYNCIFVHNKVTFTILRNLISLIVLTFIRNISLLLVSTD